ncbi:Putative ribonuclease H protein [Dendrobium catenatum]|uniref:Ribonuclease H protein n=1 Tax=Dendrobium catenatum TaxID=906689 RepID=A0A2I0W5P2_9ASPA|nr:Putative ribonuclease H protein [Dendrobium catenatum]
MVDGIYDSFSSKIKDWIIPIKGHIRNIIPVIICWYLWASRNDSKHNNIRMDAMNIISKVKNKVSQLFNANLIKPNSFKSHYNAASVFGLDLSNRKIQSREKLIYWKRPVIGCFKLNTDGSFNSDTAGCGGIIRDYNGKIVVAFAGPSSGSNAITAEIDSLKFGVDLCLSLGYMNIWVEVDALLLLHYISGNSNFNPTNFYKIREIKLALSGMNFSISHIMREGNAVADALAKMGCNLDCFYHFNEVSIPRNIRGLINLDRMGLPYMRNC